MRAACNSALDGWMEDGGWMKGWWMDGWMTEETGLTE